MERSARSLIIAGVGLAFLLIILAVQKNGELKNGSVPAGGGKINWLTELNPGLARAQETGKPIMVDFYADWCGPCKMLDAQTYSDDRVAAASTNWVMVRIDVDKNQGLARFYNVQSIPTIVALDPQGKEVRREIGFIGVGPMLTLMENVEKGLK
jgi:thiol:disulfide interchange protein